MEVVYDVKLVLRNSKLYVSEVDLSRYGLLRRMGLTGLANLIYQTADAFAIRPFRGLTSNLCRPTWAASGVISA